MDNRKMAPTIMIMFDDVVCNASSNLPCTMSPVNPVNLAEVFPEIRRQELPTFLHMEFFSVTVMAMSTLCSCLKRTSGRDD